MDTKIEDSNLAFIGSDDDKAAREAAANLEMNWEGCGQEEGIDVWRVENKRTEEGNANFGINKWPESYYGEFFQGDSYIVLKTSKDADGAFYWDIFFWIGSDSSQDEYGVAAYKANELDDLLGDAPVQHRELEGYESEEFLECFPGGIRYLTGGIESGFRDVDADTASVEVPTRLFQVRKNAGSKARSYLVNKSCKSLNEGDAFVLDAGTTVYAWYGAECSPFEKNKAIEVATALTGSRNGQATLVQDVDDEVEAFWEALGGKGEIATASDVQDDDMPEEHTPTMFILQDDDSQLKVSQVEHSKDHLDSTAVCMIDLGNECILWIGNSASKREQSQAMTMLGTYLKNFDRERNTRVSRVMEGQEHRCSSWSKAF